MLSGERHGNQHLHLRQLILPSYRGKEPESEPQGHQWTPGSYHTHTSTFTWCQYADVWFLGLWGHWGPYSPITASPLTYSFMLMGSPFLFFFTNVSPYCPMMGNIWAQNAIAVAKCGNPGPRKTYTSSSHTCHPVTRWWVAVGSMMGPLGMKTKDHLIGIVTQRIDPWKGTLGLFSTCLSLFLTWTPSP